MPSLFIWGEIEEVILGVVLPQKRETGARRRGTEKGKRERENGERGRGVILCGCVHHVVVKNVTRKAHGIQGGGEVRGLRWMQKSLLEELRKIAKGRGGKAL